ncbi:MAG: hypothetical protein RIF32_11400 [Leptospirales bacterium]|jgi:hypothetical protein
MTRFAKYYRNSAAVVVAIVVVIPGSLWASDDPFPSIIEHNLQCLQGLSSLKAAEEDRFDEFVEYSWQGKPANSQDRLNALGSPVANLPSAAKWSESAAYDAIHNERRQMIHSAERAARSRAAQSVSAAQLTAVPIWPGSPERDIQSGYILPAAAKPSRSTPAAPVKDSKLTSRTSNDTDCGVLSLAAVESQLRLQYYAIRNGYHGERDRLQYIILSPAIIISSIVSPLSASFRFSHAPLRATRLPQWLVSSHAVRLPNRIIYIGAALRPVRSLTFVPHLNFSGDLI